jgi:D-aminopeptidase
VRVAPYFEKKKKRQCSTEYSTHTFRQVVKVSSFAMWKNTPMRFIFCAVGAHHLGPTPQSTLGGGYALRLKIPVADGVVAEYALPVLLTDLGVAEVPVAEVAGDAVVTDSAGSALHSHEEAQLARDQAQEARNRAGEVRLSLQYAVAVAAYISAAAKYLVQAAAEVVNDVAPSEAAAAAAEAHKAKVFAKEAADFVERALDKYDDGSRQERAGCRRTKTPYAKLFRACATRDQ